MIFFLPITRTISRVVQCTFLIGAYSLAHAADLRFSGQLDIVELDSGGAVFSGVSIGSDFRGAIDRVTANGFISDGPTLTSFGCCIAAGGLSISNDETLDSSTAMLLNSLAGADFVAGDIVDLIQLEGDSLTVGGGRIEIGLSIGLDSLAFNDDSLDNYPPNPSDVLIALFFIAEFDDQGEAIYSALGLLDANPFVNGTAVNRAAVITIINTILLPDE